MDFKEKIDISLGKHRDFFATHQTKDIEYRREGLKKFRRAIRKFEDQLYEAMYADLHKSQFEAYATEIGIVLDEIREALRNVKKYASPTKVKTPVIHYKADSFIYPEPYGHVLIVAPWNYPFQLLMNPLVAAISAGNTVTLKTSPYTPKTAEVMEKIVNEAFESKYVSIFHGGREVNAYLFEQKWDYIFFTGSPALGKIVMQKAAEHLTPVTLELGGKSPVIVDKDANIEIAARRIIWGKLINAGQTCIAPDYMFVHKSVKDQLIEKMKAAITQFYGENPQESPDYPRIVNRANVERLNMLMEQGTIVTGGRVDVADRYVAPTLITDVEPTSPIMQEEIFGPLLPIIAFDKIDEVATYVNENPKPLALYYFSESNEKQEEVLLKFSFGGGCMNDTLMHIANHNLPFGGVGNSGMGRYHGKFGFDAFSNLRGIIKKSTIVDVPLRYAPFKDKMGMVKMLLQ